MLQLLGLALLAMPLYGGIVAKKVLVTLDGVDSAGSPSSANGGTGNGKVYKITSTGIILKIASAQVINEYGRPRGFSDRGLPITDPQTNVTVTSTNDFEYVRAPRSGTTASAGLVAVYNPQYAP